MSKYECSHIGSDRQHNSNRWVCCLGDKGPMCVNMNILLEYPNVGDIEE